MGMSDELHSSAMRMRTLSYATYVKQTIEFVFDEAFIILFFVEFCRL